METETETKPADSEVFTIKPYDPIKAELAKLIERNNSLVFDYDSDEGEKNARSYVAGLRRKKADVERLRVELKQPALDHGRKVDGVAKKLTADFDAMIEVHQKHLDEKTEREEMRIEAHQVVIRRIQALEHTPVSGPSVDIKAAIDEVDAVDVSKLEEFAVPAETEKQSCLAILRDKLEQAAGREARDAELEQLRREKAEREAKELAEKQAAERKAREDEIARQAEEKARREAEQKVLAEKERMDREANEAKERAERAEREKVEAQERADRLEKEKAEREAREAAERAANEKKQAESKLWAAQEHQTMIDEAVADIVRIAGVSHDVANVIVCAIDADEVSNIKLHGHE